MNIQEQILKKASISIEKKNYREAKSILLDFINTRKNIKIDLKFFYALYLTSNALKEEKDSKKYLEKCIKINDKNHIILNNLANIFLKEGNIFKAEKLYLKSLEVKDDYLLGIINTAIFYQKLGRFEESKNFYMKAIALSPERISIYFNISRIDKTFINEDKIEYLKKIMKNENIKSIEMGYGFFLLAEYERKKKSYIKEIEFLKKAHKYTFNEKINKNKRTLNYWQNIIPLKYNKLNFVNENNQSELIDYKPTFIVGLPRSGSTMVEAILSSGNIAIKTLGESNIINGVIVTTHNGFQKDENTKIDLNIINNKIFKIMSDKNLLNSKNKFFIDKSFENFFYIDIILKIFPNAKFINTFRNIEDNVFAIFQQSLAELSWAQSIEDILKYIDNYLKIMKFYNKKHPKKIFSLNLKELTSKPEEISKKLYNFCNLKWDCRALNFYNRKDLLISTASNIQIRKKIENYDYDKYRPYKHLLEDFYDKYDWLNQ
jgi:tetratricopeptide (TPR) repeat protein